MKEEKFIRLFYDVFVEKKQCQFCGETHMIRFKPKSKRGYYACGHYLAIYKDTPFEFTKIKMSNWVKVIIYELESPRMMYSTTAAKILDVSQSAACLALRRLREYLESDSDIKEKFRMIFSKFPQYQGVNATPVSYSVF